MATPPTADRFLTELRAEGVHIAEATGWRNRNRNHKGSWGPVNGVVIHHTAGTSSLRLCIEGTADLPGPLCHTHLSKAGVATLVGYGRANHAGTFAANAHNAVVGEAAVHPRPDAAEPIDGNRHYYGIEIENLGNGKDPYPAVQYDQAVRWAAAICRLHGWTANSVIGHKEGTRRKIDPRGPIEGRGELTMDRFRADVAERLKHPASWTPGPTTTPKPEEDDMPLTDADVRKIWLTDGFVANPNPASVKTNPYIAPATGLRNIETVVRRIETKLATQDATIGELTKTIATLAANTQAIDPDALVARIRGAIENVTIHLDADGA
jgi:hypothetical protein